MKAKVQILLLLATILFAGAIQSAPLGTASPARAGSPMMEVLPLPDWRGFPAPRGTLRSARNQPECAAKGSERPSA